jgi:hypothetical protein
MLGRIALALVAGLALGVILVGGGLYLTKPSGTKLAPALGDANAPYDLGLSLTEAFLTSQVNKPPADTTGAATKQTSLRDAKVRLREDGTIEVQGRASAYGFLVPVQAIVQPRVVNGRLEIAIVKGQAGGLTVPASVAQDIQTVLNRQIANTLAKKDFQVIAIQPGAGTLVVHLK